MGDQGLIQKLMENNPSLINSQDCYGRTPLHLFSSSEENISEEDIGVIRLLLRQPNIKSSIKDSDGYTALDHPNQGKVLSDIRDEMEKNKRENRRELTIHSKPSNSRGISTEEIEISGLDKEGQSQLPLPEERIEDSVSMLRKLK